MNYLPLTLTVTRKIVRTPYNTLRVALANIKMYWSQFMPVIETNEYLTLNQEGNNDQIK